MCTSVAFPSFPKFVLRHVNRFFAWNLFDELCKLNLWFMFLPIWTFMSPPMTRTLCFGDATNKEGYLIIEGDEVSFFIIIGTAVAWDYCCAGVSIKSSSYPSRLYFLNVIKWFLGPKFYKHNCTSLRGIDSVFPCRCSR